MKTHAKQSIELDHLNLTPEAKTEVSNLIQSLLTQAQNELKLLEGKNQALTLELAHLRRIRYGAKSEALSQVQLSLFEEDWQTDVAAIEAEIEQLPLPAPQQPKRVRTGRQPLPDHLPRIEHRHEPQSCQCKQCGSELIKIGEDVSEQLDVKPAEFFVHRHIRPQYACRTCETVVAEPVPLAVIDGGMATPGLLAWITTAKYLDHLPLYRIAQIAAREGVTLSLSTLAEWIGRVGVALQALVDRLILHLLQGRVLHADETPVAQLDPGSGKTQRAYLWAYRSNDFELGPRIIVFDYQTSRSGKHVQNFLNRWQGHLLVDDYGGYKALFSKTASPCTELGCWAHARRKFFDLHQANASTVAYEVLQRIGGLYAVEAEGKHLTIETRQQLRAEKSQPILQSLHDWLLQTRTQTANGGGTAKAIDYTLKRWQSLIRYASSGHLPIDNNPVENAIRPIALGKKNWLFTGSERAGKRAAAIQTLFGTAKLNGINPAQWLADTLEKLPAWPNNRIDELLPFAPESIEALLKECG
ncbi:MAG: IS66 family transposase, partial [Nitrosomonadaceae bacterium]|nr:IS66 family transposase [Nitrosomonadaceae bacterium]